MPLVYVCTSRPRGLGKSVITRVISMVTLFGVLMTLLTTHLLSPLGLQVCMHACWATGLPGVAAQRLALGETIEGAPSSAPKILGSFESHATCPTESETKGPIRAKSSQNSPFARPSTVPKTTKLQPSPPHDIIQYKRITEYNPTPTCTFT